MPGERPVNPSFEIRPDLLTDLLCWRWPRTIGHHVGRSCTPLGLCECPLDEVVEAAHDFRQVIVRGVSYDDHEHYTVLVISGLLERADCNIHEYDLRVERSLCQLNCLQPGRTGERPGDHQRQWRHDCDRPPTRYLGHSTPGNAHSRIPKPWWWGWSGDALCRVRAWAAIEFKLERVIPTPERPMTD